MMLFCLLATSAAVRLQTSPVEQVTTLLRDLQTQVQTEGTTEAETYDKFACFCKDKTNTKVDDIDTKETNVATLTADAAALEANIAQYGLDIKSLNVELDQLEKSLQDATEIRENEHAVYEVGFADMAKATEQLTAAIEHIKGSKTGLAEVKVTVQKTVAMAKALNMSVRNKKAITAFLGDTQMPEIPEEDYTFKSGGIIGTLEDLLTKFKARKDELASEEDKAKLSFEAAAEGKRTEMDTGKESLATTEDQLSTAQSDIATTHEDLTETTALLADDKVYLKEITAQCEEKAKHWDQRSQQRKDELSAIEQALEIIEGTVTAKAGATGAGGRSEKLLAQVSVDEPVEEYSDVVFIQKSVTVNKHDDTTAAALQLRNRVIVLLKQSGKKLNSAAINFLVMKVAADPFAKVKTLIQGLIERLLQEATDEASQKGWCDTELGKAKTTREFRHADTVTMNADIMGGQARIQSLGEDKEALIEEIATLNGDLNTATENRQTEKDENKLSLADAKEGAQAVQKAITILSDFYRGANRAFVQTKKSPLDDDMAGSEAGFSGSYKGNQAAGSGIIGMLETILSDFHRSTKSTEEAEHQAGRDFAKFSQEVKVSIASKETGLTQTENDLKMASGDMAAALNSLRDTQGLLDTTLQTLEELNPACVDTGMSYEERVERRQNEIDALKSVVAIFDEKSFLQKK